MSTETQYKLNNRNRQDQLKTRNRTLIEDKIHRILLDTQDRGVIEGCLVLSVVEELNKLIHTVYNKLKNTATDSDFSNRSIGGQLNNLLQLYTIDIIPAASPPKD